MSQRKKEDEEEPGPSLAEVLAPHQPSKAFLREQDRELAAYQRGFELRDIYIQTSQELLAIARDDTPFVVQGVVPEQGLCFLAGHPGSKKSWLAYEMALCVARGTPWFCFDVPKARPVLVMNYDNPGHELARRFKRLGLKPTDQVHFHSLAAKPLKQEWPPVLRIPEARTPILQILSVLKPGLIIIDSYRQSHTGDEKDSTNMMLVMSYLREMTATFSEPAILIIHHFRKQLQNGKQIEEEDSMRGSSEIEASADMIAFVRKGGFELKKTRGWEPEEGFERFSFAVEDYVSEEGAKRTRVIESETLNSVLWVLSREGKEQLSREQLAAELGIPESQARILVKKGIVDGVLREVRRGTEATKASRLIEIVPERKAGAEASAPASGKTGTRKKKKRGRKK